MDPTVRTAAKSYSSALAALTERQEKAVENGAPTAHVITLPRAHHHVFLSNEAEVVREMRAFLTGLRLQCKVPCYKAVVWVPRPLRC